LRIDPISGIDFIKRGGRKMRRTLSMVLIAVVSTAGLAAAQVATQQQPETPPPSFSLLGLIVYPADGQSPEQQALDEAACWEWAEAQTGMKIVIGEVDTEAAAQAAGDQAADATRGAAVAGAARGALAGAAIGAIAGDAGQGAAIGAAAGGMRGRRARRGAIAQSEQQGAEAAAAANEEALDQFKKAGSLCLQGRGYTAG
jgi:hypothetical protein